jgi:hypothetical protein
MTLANRTPQPLHDRQFDKLVDLKKTGAKSIVDIMIVVGDIVGDRCDLRLECGPRSKVKIPLGICL